VAGAVTPHRGGTAPIRSRVIGARRWPDSHGSRASRSSPDARLIPAHGCRPTGGRSGHAAVARCAADPGRVTPDTPVFQSLLQNGAPICRRCCTTVLCSAGIAAQQITVTQANLNSGPPMFRSTCRTVLPSAGVAAQRITVTQANLYSGPPAQRWSDLQALLHNGALFCRACCTTDNDCAGRAE